MNLPQCLCMGQELIPLHDIFRQPFRLCWHGKRRLRHALHIALGPSRRQRIDGIQAARRQYAISHRLTDRSNHILNGSDSLYLAVKDISTAHMQKRRAIRVVIVGQPQPARAVANAHTGKLQPLPDPARLRGSFHHRINRCLLTIGQLRNGHNIGPVLIIPRITCLRIVQGADG